MNLTTRIFFRTLLISLAISIVVVSWVKKPAMAQTREIPVYVQIHLNKVIGDAAVKGDIVLTGELNFDTIVALLNHKNHRVASAAAYALGEIRDTQAVPALVLALESDRDHMRRIAAHALGKIGDKRAVTPLIDMLKDAAQPLAVQATVAMSLGRIGDPEAKQILTRLNHSSQNWLQHTTYSALLKIDAKHGFKVALAN